MSSADTPLPSRQCVNPVLLQRLDVSGSVSPDTSPCVKPATSQAIHTLTVKRGGQPADGHYGLPTRLMGVKEAAAYIGLSKHTLYTMVSQRRIPFTKLGRLTKFDRVLLDDWLGKHTVMPVSHVRAA